MTTDVQTPPEKRKVSDLLIGRPLETRTLAHQVVSKKVGLAVFASDAISSTAYATEEILVILALAGSVALGLWLLSPSVTDRPFTPIPTAAGLTSSPARTWARRLRLSPARLC